jgi:hypothetical protein
MRQPGDPVTAEEARAIVAAALDPDDPRVVGIAHRRATYWAVELGVPCVIELGGLVPTVTVASGELVWRDELEVALARRPPHATPRPTDLR